MLNLLQKNKVILIINWEESLIFLLKYNKL